MPCVAASNVAFCTTGTLGILGNEKSEYEIFQTEDFSWTPTRDVFAPKCSFFHDLEGLTKVFGQKSAVISLAQ